MRQKGGHRLRFAVCVRLCGRGGRIHQVMPRAAAVSKKNSCSLSTRPPLVNYARHGRCRGHPCLGVCPPSRGIALQCSSLNCSGRQTANRFHAGASLNEAPVLFSLILIPPLLLPFYRRPVPCGDGQCHTDYISCLRSLSSVAERLGSSTDNGKAHSLELLLAEAMRAGSGSFDEKGPRAEEN